MKNLRKVVVTDSKFAMWRSAISLAHADHRLTNSETAIIAEYSENYDFSEEQRKILESDMAKGVAIESVLPAVTDNRDRAHLINFARVLFHVDDNFSAAEEKILSFILDTHFNKVDLKTALSESRKEAQAIYQRHIESVTKKIEEENKKKPLIALAFDYIIDLIPGE